MNNCFKKNLQEYRKITEEINKKYKKLFNSVILQTKADISKDYAIVLGEEYELVTERLKSFNNGYSELIRRAFDLAIENGGEMYIDGISKCASDDTKDVSYKTQRVTELLEGIIELIGEYDPVLIVEIRNTQEKMNECSKQIKTMVQNNSEQLNKVRDSIKQRVQKDINVLLDKYNNEITSVQSEYGIEHNRDGTPFDKFALAIDAPADDDTFFIPSNNSKGYIN